MVYLSLLRCNGHQFEMDQPFSVVHIVETAHATCEGTLNSFQHLDLYVTLVGSHSGQQYSNKLLTKDLYRVIVTVLSAITGLKHAEYP